MTQNLNELKESPAALQAALENVVDGIIIIDEKGLIKQFNPAAESIFGYTTDEVIGNNIKMLMPEPYHGEHDQYLKNYLNTKSASIIGLGREVIGLKKNGTQFPCDLGISEVWVDDQRLFTGIIRDISERKQTEQRLKDSENRVKAVIENAIDGIITIDEKGLIKQFNPAAESIFGYSADEVIEKNIKRLMPKPYCDEHDQYLENYLKTNKARIIGIGREVMGMRKNGSQFPCDLGISEMWVEDQRFFTGIVRDITEKKQLEQRENMAKSEFLYRMSHEFHTPMHAILGFSQLLKQSKNIQENRNDRESIDEIFKAGNHLLQLINKVLDFSQIDAKKNKSHFEKVFIFEIIKDVIASHHSMIESSKIKIVDNMHHENKTQVKGDPKLFYQIFDAILKNAIKYNTEYGTITFESINIENKTTCISIHNTGEKIPENMLEKIFDPFFRLEKHKNLVDGIGMGLTLTRKFAELMDGTVTAINKQGGCCFTLKLPLS